MRLGNDVSKEAFKAEFAKMFKDTVIVDDIPYVWDSESQKVVLPIKKFLLKLNTQLQPNLPYLYFKEAPNYKFKFPDLSNIECMEKDTLKGVNHLQEITSFIQK